MSRPSNSFRIASYNIRKGIGLDRRRLPERAMQVINTIDADFVAIQEVDRRLGERPAALGAEMISRFSDFRPAPVAVNDVSLGWHGNALLLRKGFVATAIQRVDLPSLEPRGAIMVDIDGPAKLRIIALHLGLLRRNRREQLLAVLKAYEAASPRPTIILGDFNEWSTTRGVEPLAPAFRVKSPGKSYHASRPFAALDKIAISAEISMIGAGVINEGLARIASDHLPVWMDFSIPGANAPE